MIFVSHLSDRTHANIINEFMLWKWWAYAHIFNNPSIFSHHQFNYPVYFDDFFLSGMWKIEPIEIWGSQSQDEDDFEMDFVFFNRNFCSEMHPPEFFIFVLNRSTNPIQITIMNKSNTDCIRFYQSQCIEIQPITQNVCIIQLYLMIVGRFFF